MLQTIEAIVNPDGTVRLLEKLRVSKPTRVILTLLPHSSSRTSSMPSGVGNDGSSTAKTISRHTMISREDLVLLIPQQPGLNVVELVPHYGNLTRI